MLRFDAAIARLTVALTKMMTGKDYKASDFMPWPKQEPQPASPQEVLAFLKSTVRKRDK